MTPQEIFDKVYLGVISQGGPSVKLNGSCAYRGMSGAKCAIGHLISDDAARLWDRVSVSKIDNIVSNKFKYVEPWMAENLNLLKKLQLIHDGDQNGTFVGDMDKENYLNYFKEEMIRFAKQNNLIVSETEIT